MNKPLHWLDLPDDDLKMILGYDSPNTSCLSELNKSYQALDKTNPDLLEARIDNLEIIVKFIDDWINNKLEEKDKIKHIKILHEIAICKKNYLIEILKLKTDSHSLQKNLYDYHYTQEKNLSDLDIVYLNKLRMFSIKKREYWGDFWCVTLDPCHRQLTNYLRIWEKVRSKNCNMFDFFMWLEGQEVPLNQPYEKYLSSIEKENCMLKIRDGFLYTEDGAVANFNDKGKKYIYVVDTNLGLYVAEETDSMYHSCFCRGRPVVSAGKLVIVDGVITEVSFESGHYIPSIKVGYQLFHILRENGIKFDTDVSVSFFFDRNKYTETVNPEKLKSLDSFQESLISSINEKKKCNA
jgi:hypothetical protein